MSSLAHPTSADGALAAAAIRRLCAEPWLRVLAKSVVVSVAGSRSDALMFIVALDVALRLG